jgi:hypothetical protein
MFMRTAIRQPSSAIFRLLILTTLLPFSINLITQKISVKLSPIKRKSIDMRQNKMDIIHAERMLLQKDG